MNLFQKEINLYFRKGYCFEIEDYMDEPLCISNHVLLALAVYLVQLQTQVLSNLKDFFVYNKLDHQYYKLLHYRSELGALKFALF